MVVAPLLSETVSPAMPGSPAIQSALEQGDELLTVDGMSTRELGWNGTLARLTSSSEVPAVLAVRRGSEEFSVSLPRVSREALLADSGVRLEDGGFRPIEETPEPEPGQSSPSFHGVDVRSGKEIRSEQFLGHCVVLSFWTSWCGACAREFKSWQAATPPHVPVVWVELSETSGREDGRGTSPPPGPILRDGSWFGPLSRSVHVYERGVPWAVLIGRDGRILGQGRSAFDLARDRACVSP